MKQLNYFFILIYMLLILGCNENNVESLIEKPRWQFEPLNINDGWEIANPSDANIDSLAIIKIFNNFRSDTSLKRGRSLTIIRNGKLIAEIYTKDQSDRTTPREVWSCTKQVIGILTGLAIDKGIIESLDDRLDNYLPAECAKYPDKSSITIKHLLQMQSGISQTFYDWRILPELEPETNFHYLSDFLLSNPMKTKPGEAYDYKISDPSLLSLVIQSKTGKPTDQWGDENLFSKIEFRNYRWLRFYDGSTFGGFGLETTPRELGKIGLMLVNKGKYKSYQAVSENWVSQMEFNGLGYLWGKSKESSFMAGKGGQYVIYYRNLKLVIVISSEIDLNPIEDLKPVQAFAVADSIAAYCK